MHTTVGELKTEVLAARLKEVVPEVDIKVISQEIQENILPDIILNSDPPDYVIDAIDQLGNKCKLIDYCYKNKIPLVTSMGAGGKMDPTKIRVFDLADTQEDALAKSVRFYLRRKRNFPRDDFFDIPAVCSLEKPHRPWDVKEDGSYNPKTLQESRQEPRNTKTKVIMGTAAFVTPVFGFTCASIVIRKLLGENIELDETPRAQEIRRMKKTAEKKLLKKQKKS